MNQMFAGHTGPPQREMPSEPAVRPEDSARGAHPAGTPTPCVMQGIWGLGTGAKFT